MSKDSISDFDTDPAGNTDIGGISIEGSGDVANFDNAFRELMSQLKNDLGNVDNTSDADKPVSTAQQDALDGKVDASGGNMTGDLNVPAIITSNLSTMKRNDTKGIVKLEKTGTDAGVGYIGADSENILIAQKFDSSGEFFKVTQDGQVLKPEQPAFYAAGSGSSHSTTALGVIPFSSALFNVGNDYNTSNSRFTAPVDGMYIFFAHIFSNEPTNTERYMLAKNGLGLSDGYLLSAAPGAGMAYTGSRMVSLNSGDYVDIRTNYGNGTVWLGHCAFFGYLIG